MSERIAAERAVIADEPGAAIQVRLYDAAGNATVAVVSAIHALTLAAQLVTAAQRRLD